MSAIPNEPIRMTEAAYLEFERSSEFKHEYINGEVVAMAGASRAHNLLCSEIARLLGNQLLEKPCEIYIGDMRVKAQAASLYTYSDVTVVCGEAKFHDKVFDTLLNPTIIVEVLSPSTERYDKVEKFQDFRTISSLKEYLIVSQDKAHIEHYKKQDNGLWVLKDAKGLEATIQLESLDCKLELKQVYRQIKFESNEKSDT